MELDSPIPLGSREQVEEPRIAVTLTGQQRKGKKSEVFMDTDLPENTNIFQFQGHALKIEDEPGGHRHIFYRSSQNGGQVQS